MKGRISYLFIAILTIITEKTLADDLKGQDKALFTRRCASCYKPGTILSRPGFG